MARRIAIKRLTASDLTLFEWHFRNRNAGNQKSINLNANIFVDRLYPFLPETEIGRTGRIPLDLFIYGPGLAAEWNLQRKIIKQGSYKNWRLNGEFIGDPPGEPDRFKVLRPDDYVILDFEGDFVPHAAKAVFVAANASADASLHAAIVAWNPGSMRAIDHDALGQIIRAANVAADHPVNELLLDAALEDAAQNGIEGTRKLLARRSGRKLSREELERARRNAEDIGREGEEFVDALFVMRQNAGQIISYEWVAADNAVSPFDFRVELTPANHCRAEVKSTRGPFDRTLHISTSELYAIRDGGERYDLYRVYDVRERLAKVRIAEDVRQFATDILAILETLPQGVTPDGISVRPAAFRFGAPITINLDDLPEPA